MIIQYIIIGLILVLCILYIVLKIFHTFAKKKCGCNECESCPFKDNTSIINDSNCCEKTKVNWNVKQKMNKLKKI
ncbi:MAG: hypothetical protein J5918_09270 [Prevotella sp.]|nr:hypothetical protein [Prevotella sp.]